MTITTLDQLHRWLFENVPGFAYGTQNQYKSRSFVRSAESWGTWTGTDGLLWWFNEDGITLYDRQGEVDPETGRPHRYSLEEVWSSLPIEDLPEITWEPILEQLIDFKRVVLRSKVIRTHDTNVVQVLHNAVQRAYWREYKLSDALIDHFMLGYGQEAEPHYPFPRHTIPVPIYSLPSKYTFLTRRAVEADPHKHKMPKGSPRSLWIGDFEQPNPSRLTKKIYYVEGGMAMLSAQQMGLSPCFTGTHGADYWDSEWSEFLLRTYPMLEEVVFFPDNDQVGRAQMIRVIRSFHYLLGDTSRKLSYQQMIWDDDTPQGYDPADVLQHLEVEQARSYLEARLDYVTLEDLEPHRNHNRYIRHAAPYSEPENVVTLDNLRNPSSPQSIQAGINYYLDVTYPRNPETVYVNASYPGSGKNYALVQVAQTRAEAFLRKQAERERERASQVYEIEQRLLTITDEVERESLERVVTRLRKPLSKKFAVIASPFRPSFEDMQTSHPNFKHEMWFYFDSRNRDNCENYDKAEKAAQLGYNVSSAVCRFCPFFDKCNKEGYLSQFETMEQFPIISVRHQHLPIKNISAAQEVYIDEYAGDALFSQRMITLRAADIRLPQGWEEWVARDQIAPIQQFLTLLQGVLTTGAFHRRRGINTPVLYMGRPLFDRLNNHCRLLFDIELEDLIHSVEYTILCDASLTRLEDEIELIHNRETSWKTWDLTQVNTTTLTDLPKRGLDILFKVLSEELVSYNQDVQATPNWNSRVSLCGDRLEVRPMDPVTFNSPVVVTDATPVPAIYDRMFPDREVIIYEPLTHNPETETTVLYGNGFGVTEMNKNLYAAVHNGELYAAVLNDAEFPNAYLKYSFDTITRLAETHTSLLVISHKLPSLWLSSRFKDSAHISFNHYGNVRGLNTYVDYEAVLLIGINRASDTEIIKEVSAWYHQDPDPLVPEGKKTYDFVYHGHKVDEEFQDGFQFWGFEDERLANIAFGKIGAEIKQAANRIRPHTRGEKRYVYMLGSFPALDFVTHTFEYKEWLYQERKELREYLYTWLKDRYDPQSRYPFPGIRPVREALVEAGFKIGQVSLSALKKDCQEEIVRATS